MKTNHTKTLLKTLILAIFISIYANIDAQDNKEKTDILNPTENITDTDKLDNTVDADGGKISPTTQTDSSKFEKLEKKIESFIHSQDSVNKRLLTLIKSDKDSVLKYGTIRFNKKVKVENGGFDKLESIDIKKVELYIDEGILKEIHVHTEKGLLFKSKIYLPLNYFNKSRQLKIYLDKEFRDDNDNDKKSYIYIGNLLSYKPNIGNPFIIPGKQTIVLINDNPKDMKYNSSLSSFLEFRTYTDFFSLVGNQTNGLVQAEIKGKIITNTFGGTNSKTIWLNSVTPKAIVAKFDSKYQSVAMDSSNIYFKDSVGGNLPSLSMDRIKLNQLAFLNIGIDVSVFKWFFNTGSNLEFHYTGRYKYVDLKYNKDDIRHTYLNTHGLSLSFSLPSQHNFGLETSFGGVRQIMATHSGFDKTKFSGFNNGDWRTYTNFQLEVYYNPLGAINNMIFLKFYSFYSWEEMKGYNQLQVGYRSKFSLSKQ